MQLWIPRADVEINSLKRPKNACRLPRKPPDFQALKMSQNKRRPAKYTGKCNVIEKHQSKEFPIVSLKEFAFGDVFHTRKLSVTYHLAFWAKNGQNGFVLNRGFARMTRMARMSLWADRRVKSSYLSVQPYWCHAPA
jgi:hypothetical protein